MPERPNVLYLHSHDTGRYVQPYGYGVPTPNIQLLADQGVLFRQAFCAGPTCSASRSALLTGQYPHQNGMNGLAHRGWALDDPSRHIVHPLRDAGYRSVLIGEQHVSEDPGILGYDEVLDVDSTRAEDVAPLAIDALAEAADADSPFFMSVGFFETHRQFTVPTSVRDTLYSLPPPNIPDTPQTREDMAAFKASARELDQGVGAVLNGLARAGLAESTLVICTTDHGLPFPGAKATLFDRGTGVLMILRGPGGFDGGRVIDPMVSHLDLYPTICELAGAVPRHRLEGASLLPLVADEVPELHREIYAEMTYHAAYQPQRSVRTNRWKYIRRFGAYDKPVLANCDDSASKQVLIDAGWGTRPVAEERLYDLISDPSESNNLVANPACARELGLLRAKLEAWMRETRDPLLDGPIAPPPGALFNLPEQRSAEEPPSVAGAHPFDTVPVGR
ncbi:sulfatase [Thermoleophilia bacterium SCSIO 60948]|nr:sulfatase [Thermoleophilia bacterium SCSIO 60948]